MKPRRQARSNSRRTNHRPRRTAAMAAVLFTLASITGYVALSFTINGVPTYPQVGWVAVLQPASATYADTVQLLVQARTEGGQTEAAYDVVVCGPQPYSGDLLIGGTAQLTAVRPYFLLPSFRTPPVQRIRDLAFYYGGLIDLGSVQLVHINLPYVPACPPTNAVQSAGILPGGSAEEVAGLTSGPVQQSWSGPWGLWHGPHATQAWPLIGAFPGVPGNALGEYLAVSGLSSNWSRPLQAYVKVTADDVPVTWSVDSAVPSASGPYPLTWQERNPVSPVVRLTDSSSMALLQDWVIIFAVVFGIAGSVLASLIFEWLRRPSQECAAAGRALPADGTSANPPAVRARTAGGWLALAGAVIFIGYAGIRRTRVRRR